MPTAGASRRMGSLALVASLMLHVLGWLWFRGVARLPDIEIEIQPSEAEFGVAQKPTAPPRQRAVPPPPPPSAASSAAAPATPGDAPRPEPRAKARPPEPPKNSFPEAGTAGRFAPQGSQLALRLDLESIGRGPFADEVGALLAAIPDVRALLEGSGVDPMHDLSRLFLASPDLRREHVVMAGRYRGGESMARQAVEQLAGQRGEPASWRTQRGIAVAPWRNSDPTPRVLALIGPSLFAITREQDLPRVIAVAQSLQGANTRGSAADALVHMAERELMNVSVENARSFVRGARTAQMPEQLTLSARAETKASQGLDVSVVGRYPDAAQAEAALQYWEDLRARYAGHPLVELFGVASLLRSAKLVTKEQTLSTELSVSTSQARLLLRVVRDSLRPPTAPRANAAPSGAPPTHP